MLYRVLRPTETGPNTYVWTTYGKVHSDLQKALRTGARVLGRILTFPDNVCVKDYLTPTAPFVAIPQHIRA